MSILCSNSSITSIFFSPMLDESLVGGVRRGSSGSAFSHLKSSRAASREDINSSPSRSLSAAAAAAAAATAKHASNDKLAETSSKDTPGKMKRILRNLFKGRNSGQVVSQSLVFVFLKIWYLW